MLEQTSLTNIVTTVHYAVRCSLIYEQYQKNQSNRNTNEQLKRFFARLVQGSRKWSGHGILTRYIPSNILGLIHAQDHLNNGDGSEDKDLSLTTKGHTRKTIRTFHARDAYKHGR